jgi:FADH2 O2-dependent halogenase
VAATAPVAARLGLSQGAPAWGRLLDTLPSVAAQFAEARPTRPFVHTPRIAFRTRRVAGLNWALLPSAAGVIDPLLSTGFPLTLLGVSRLLTILEGSPGAGRAAALREYEQVTLEELDATEHLVAALYATMADPPLFKRLSLLYFAAASYSELARRIGRRERAQGFLLVDRVGFAHELHACAALASGPLDEAARDALIDRIDQAIAPIDVAAFRDRSRRDWYPALPELGLPVL